MFKTTEYICEICKKTFISRVRYDRKVRYCSKECCGISKVGIPAWNRGKKRTWISPKFSKGNVPWNKGKKLGKPWNFKGKYLGGDGYVRIFHPHHPNTTKMGYMLEHRLVAEKYLGRFLTKEEQVHHINEIRDDNRPENLYVFENGVLHRRFHKSGKTIVSNLTS